MKVIDGIENLKNKFPYPVLTLGNFDGVHLGHQSIFRMITERALKKKGTSVVFTFEPHPLRVIAPERAPKLLTTFQDKINLIATADIDLTICAHFTAELAHMSAEEFAEKILVDQVGVKEIYIGPNYKFGKGRKGTPELLAEIGKELGFTVKAIPEIKSNNITFSSSKVRTLIAKGKVSEAAAYLGRNYSVEGVVIEGAKRGSTLLSTPTANISTSNELLPMDGVYAVTAELGGKIYGGAANIGCNPTFGEKKYSFEVHIFKFNKKIVGKSLKVNFIERIRDEVKFSSADELKIQMMSDITSIKNMLEKLGV